MIILDTNVLSALLLREPDPRVVEWLDAQPAESVWTTSVTVFEILYGLAILPKGRRRDGLERVFEEALREDLGDRVLAFDEDAAREASALAARARKTGRMVDVRDVQIGGIASSRRAQVATRNVRHFEVFGTRTIDPWEG